MSIVIPISQLVAMRPGVSDRTLVDYLDLAVLAKEPGTLPTRTLRDRWGCSQSMVSRRVAAVERAGLVDVTASWHGYQVHAVRRWEAA